MKAFERAELARLGLPQGIIMRHRPAHFQHLFASSACTSRLAWGKWVEGWPVRSMSMCRVVVVVVLVVCGRCFGLLCVPVGRSVGR